LLLKREKNEFLYMFKLAIFDFDGVIFNSAKYYLETRALYFKQFGIKFTKQDKKDNLATTTKDFISYVNKKYNLKVSYKKYASEKKEIFNTFLPKIKPNPGVKNLLKELKKHKVKIALSSSNNREIVISLLNKYDLTKYFDLILCLEDIKKHKPNPEAYLKPAKLLNINTNNCVGIEDALQGVVSINSAKMKSIAVLSEFTTLSDFKKLNTSLIVKSMADLKYNKISLLFK